MFTIYGISETVDDEHQLKSIGLEYQIFLIHQTNERDKGKYMDQYMDKCIYKYKSQGKCLELEVM